MGEGPLSPRHETRLHRISRRTGLVLAAASVAALAAMACPTLRPEPPPRPTSAGRVRLAELSAAELPTGRSVGAEAGDWLIEAAPLRAVVAADGIGRTSAGALVDIARARWDADNIESLRSALLVGGTPLPLRLVDIRPEFDGPPRLVIIERHEVTGVSLVTEVVPRPNGEALELVTTVSHRGRSELREVQFADELRWAGRETFAMGSGVLQGRTALPTRLLLLPAEQLTYALVFDQAAVEARTEMAAQPPHLLRSVSGGFTLTPGAVRTFRRTLLVIDAGIDRAAELAFRQLGYRVGHVRGVLQPPPSWGRVIALDDAGRPALQVDVSGDGRFHLPLPAGNYTLRLEVPGGSDEAELQVTPDADVTPEWLVPEPARVKYRISDERGRSLPARLSVHGVPPTPDPVLGPAHQASGAGFAAYSRSGQGSLELPPGRYRVLVSHGMEYSLFEQTVQVSRDRGATLRVRLDHLVDMPDWLACDFHVHAEPSPDSQVPLSDRVTSLLAEGVEFAVATDHNHVTSYAAAIAELGATELLTATEGVEITTTEWGHFNAYPYPLGDPPQHSDIAPDEIFKSVRGVAPEAVIQINHPRMSEIGYFDRGEIEKEVTRPGFSFEFDAIEVFNGFDLGNLTQVQRNLQDWYRLLELGFRYTAVGSSDSHSLVYQWVGYPRSYVKLSPQSEGRSPGERVAEAVRQGRVFVTNGPLLDLRVAGAGPGELTSPAEGPLEVELTVKAAPWVHLESWSLVVDGIERDKRRLTRRFPTELVLRDRTTLTIDRDAWVHVIVRGREVMERALPAARALPLAFTNPVYVDRDGDGVFRRPNVVP